MHRLCSNPAVGTAYEGIGNVSGLVDSADGSLDAKYEYGAFGEPLRVAGTAIADDNPFRFSTKYLDTESGLIYYGFRYYSPSLGRFINRDPIGEAGGQNLYGFVGNDPVNNWDYLGMTDHKKCQNPDDPECAEDKEDKEDKDDSEDIEAFDPFEVNDERDWSYQDLKEVARSLINIPGSATVDRTDYTEIATVGGNGGGSGGGGKDGCGAEKKMEEEETECSELSLWQSFTNWVSSIGGEQRPLRQINNWFGENPGNWYMSPAEYERLKGAQSFSSPDSRSTWTTILVRESVSSMTIRGAMYSAAKSSGTAPVPNSIDGKYPRAARVPRSVTGGGAGVSLVAGPVAGQATAATTLSKFAFSYHNFIPGIWRVSDVSLIGESRYLSEGQARETIKDVYKWYGRDLSANFYKKDQPKSKKKCK